MACKKVIIMGNRSRCGTCRGFAGSAVGQKEPVVSKGIEALKAALPGIEVLDADYGNVVGGGTLLYIQNRGPAGFPFPGVRLLDEKGESIAFFDNAGKDPAKIAARIKALCPDCCGDAVPPVDPGSCDCDDGCACPKCGAKLRVVLASLLAVLGLLAAGCGGTDVAVAVPGKGAVTISNGTVTALTVETPEGSITVAPDETATIVTDEGTITVGPAKPAE